MGVIRNTFLVDPNRNIAHIKPKVSVKGHTEKLKTMIAHKSS
jgi:peroxiredoxin